MSEIEVSRDGQVAVVRLNRPDRLNAITPENSAVLHEVFVGLGDDPEVRVIVITGTGRGFCTGAEVGGLAQRAAAIREGNDGAEAAAAAARDPSRQQRDTGFTPRRARVFKPVIVAVNGVCAGAGLHFVADADIAIAAESATFLDPHVSVGQVAALEPILFIRGGVPMNTVLRMVILGREERIDAQRALAAGFISEIVPDDQLMDRSMELARRAAAASPAALQASLRAIWGALELPLSEAYHQGYLAIGEHRSHPDAVEGATAFVQRRAPIWSMT